MKRIFKHIAVALASSLLAVGCYPEILAPDQSQLPEASALDVVIEVDQATNYVTFKVNNEGVVPMWIFGDDKVEDGKVSKKYSYTVNGLKLRVRDAGTHQVEVKAYNANGISVGSKIVEYTLENTYRDPFDPAPYMKKLANRWQWNFEKDGHFGCGSNTSVPAEWWAAKANEKADWFIYDDIMTFTADGKYSFDPGKDNKVYVNAGFTALGTSPDGADFNVEIPAYETTYTVENNWNDAGIEEIWLVLPEHKNLSYIPNQTIYDDPRFLVTELSSKEVKLASQNAPNGDGTISWLYNFVTAGASPIDLLAGTAATGKAWVLDSAVQGHVGCGWDAENAAGWWAAGPNEKADFGMYDDVVTFFPDGKYKYETGADGLMYINKEVTKVGPGGADADIDVEYPGIEATFTFDGEKIVLPEGTPMVYVSSDAIWDSPEFFVTELTETTLKVVTFKQTVGNPDGIAWQMIFKARDIKAPAGPTLNGQELPAELSVSQGEVLNVGNLNVADIWVDPDFFEVDGANLKFKAVAGDYKFTYDKGAKWIKVVPMVDGAKATYENGKALWFIGDGGGKPTIDQTIGWNTGDAPLPMAQINDNTYQITLHMKAEGGSVKIFGQSDWGTEWTKNKYGTVTDNGFFHIPNDDGNIHTIEGTEPGYYTFTVVDNDGILDMTVDKYRDPSDVTGLPNMWDNAAIDVSFWFANDGWSQIANPEYEAEGKAHTIVVPEGIGASQWQGQMVFNHTGLVVSPEKKYTFKVTFLSDEDHPHVTIKPCYQHPTEKDGNGNPADVNELFFKADLKLTADEECVFTAAGIQGTDIPDLKLVFDFGGAVAGSTITIKDITLVEL